MSTINLPYPAETDPADGANQIRELAQAVAAVLMASMFKPGFISLWGGAIAPDGWLVCNGQPISRTIYAALFDVIRDTYGAGDGSTTFQLPDFRGRTVRVDPFNLGWRAGSDEVALSVAQLPPHGHGLNDPGHAHPTWMDNHNHNGFTTHDDAFPGVQHVATKNTSDINSVNTGGANATQRQSPGSLDIGWYAAKGYHRHYFETSWNRPGVYMSPAGTNMSVQNNGGGQAHPNLPACLNVNAIIKF